ncbi:SRPBCC family protein [Bifidobacterium favimelis]|uniref:SRPBCC family protein n=1 Tax=Bifidobacterium favimelis TaxID=3122979 RepID=A0ABU8ZPJ4_9BIFI
MKFSYEMTTDLSMEQLWPYYADVKRWFAWESDLEDIELDGAFATGTTGRMTMTGQPPMPYTLVKVEEGRSFTDKSTVPDVGDVYFAHELAERDGRTLIRHSVELVPVGGVDTPDTAHAAAGIFSDVPDSVFALIKSARE